MKCGLKHDGECVNKCNSTVTRAEQLELIRRECIKANAEIETYNCECFTGCHAIGRPIRLADVLLAIGEFGHHNIAVTSGSVIIEASEIGWRDCEPKRLHWNLRKDDLTLQTDEFIQFAYDLLK